MLNVFITLMEISRIILSQLRLKYLRHQTFVINRINILELL